MRSARVHVFVWRFLAFLVLFFCFAAPHLHAQSLDRADAAGKVLQSNPDSAPDNQQSRAPTQTETDQYRLSRERYQKAISYSRAGYTLYFGSYFLAALVLLSILRLGIAAKFRDVSEAVSQKKWIQCLLFVPLLILLTDLFELPVRIYWHALGLRYQHSFHHGGPGFWGG